MRFSLCIAFVIPSALFAQERSPLPPADAPAVLRIASPTEPGPPLELVLRFIDAATKRVLPQVGGYVYQTDSLGRYTPENAMDNGNARLHGWFRTGADGIATIRTILPGSYPGTRVPRHVHLVLRAEGYRERVTEIVFDDDPFVDGSIRAETARPLSGFILCRPTIQRSARQCALDVLLTR